MYIINYFLSWRGGNFELFISFVGYILVFVGVELMINDGYGCFYYMVGN